MNLAIIGDFSLHKQMDSMLKQFASTNQLNLNLRFFMNEDGFLSFSNKLQNIPFNLIIILHSPAHDELFNFAAKIKLARPSCEIVFSSYSDKFAVEGYKINLSFYLLQPFTYNEFAFALNKCLKHSIYDLKYITINSNWQKIKIELNQIQFAEKLGHNVIIKTAQNTFSTRCTFMEFLKKFQNNENFINCVKGALVNLNWVDTVESQNFLMKSGDRISIRRKDRKKIKQIYNDFLIRKKQQNAEKCDSN